MKTNIRLFVPNTTETLSFEYGLLIHYMTYNEVKAKHEISLDYYELSKIDPMTHALDIVELVVVTEATRSHSRHNGFTLSNHYKLSFDQRYNNKIAEQSVRQVWLWLHCNESIEYSFIVEKITDTEQLISTHNNQLFNRLWAHEDWLDRDVNPLEQKAVGGRTGLVTLLTQQLAQQFELIEQENRKKVVAAIQAANPPALPPVSPPAAVVPVVVAVPAPSTPPPEPVAAPIAPPPISVRPPAPAAVPVNDREYQPIPPRAPAKSKTWIWVVAACLIGIPVWVLIGQSGQTEQTPAYDTATEAQPSVAEDAVSDTAIAADAADAAIVAADADAAAPSAVLAERPPIRVGMQWRSKTTDYRDPRGSLDDVVYEIISNQDGIVSIDKTITARPDSKVTLLYDGSLNLIGGRTGRYVPALANYDFPLVQGKTWDVTSEVIGNQYKDLQNSVGEVVGAETLSTAMGDLETIKLVVTHTTYLAGVEVSQGQDISWYAPELGRAVRTEETYWDTGTQAWVLGRLHEMTSVLLP